MEYFINIKKLLEDPGGFSLSRLNAEAETIRLKDKKLVIDVALRGRMLHLLASDSMDEVKALLKMCVAAALANICSAQTPFVLFADVFNTKPISVCQELFAFMEETITTLKDVPLFDSGRNMLLRMCNDLLRRLSKSQNTGFCGQIQLFLSRLFPLDEKSGLNLMSNFNLDKETPYNKTPEPSLFCHQSGSDSFSGDFEESELKTKSRIEVDANLYVRFWSVQDFFKIPTLCFDKNNWTVFQNCSETIFDVFSSIKLKFGNDRDASFQSNASKFSKYLTSEKLLDLQLMDPSFRRYILVQFLVVFQYLTTPNKFKTPEQVLTNDQLEWVNRKRDVVLQLLSDGKKPKRSQSADTFVSIIERFLERETYWNRWKNDGCPSFVRPSEKSPTSPRKRRVNALVDRSGNKILRFGNRILDRLWNVCPDNLAACRDEKRLFRPTLQGYFQDAILELDPAEKVEEEYKSINREEWCWRALRFLSRRSPHFYINWNPPGRPVKDYLTVILTEKMQPEDDKKSTQTTAPDSATASHDTDVDKTEPSPAKLPRLSEGEPSETTLAKCLRSSEKQTNLRTSKKGSAGDKSGGLVDGAASRALNVSTDSSTEVYTQEDSMLDDEEFTVKSDPDAELLSERGRSASRRS